MSKSIVHAAHSGKKRLLIVDKRDAEEGSEVCLVTRHGDILEKDQQPEARHKFTVKTIGSAASSKEYIMTRNAAGKFKMFDQVAEKKKKTAEQAQQQQKKKKREGSEIAKPVKVKNARNLTDADVKAIAAALKK